MTTLTPKQLAARSLLSGPAKHVMLFGGSRSGKTFLLVRQVILRALKAPHSRHAILRFRLNHLKSSILADTFPKVMRSCFDHETVRIDKQDLYAEYPNGAQIWFGGLDDKDRTEKILGQEHATMYLNECSQIPWSSVEVARTRLAQKVTQDSVDGLEGVPLRPKMYYDCNPPTTAHWSYRLFIAKEDPITGRPLHEPDAYAAMQINPQDNVANLAPDYLRELEGLSARARKRFLLGEFGDANPNALFSEPVLERWRVTDGLLPDMVRIVVGVDPSGAGDVDNADNDWIGIVVVGLGTDGVAYVLEDCSLKAGPGTWSGVVASAFERHDADCVVAEVNFGGAMVEYVIRSARSKRVVPVRTVTASRGKSVRAEPVSALAEQGKVRMVGDFLQLEQELLGFSTSGYAGEGSPNRADAMIWAVSCLFPGIVSRAPRDQRRASMAEM